MGSVTKDDLTSLRAALKQDLIEETLSHLPPPVGKVNKLQSEVEVLQKKVCEPTILSSSGLPVQQNENLDSMLNPVNDLLREVGIKDSVPINDNCRIGRQGQSYTMPMMVKFVRHTDKRKLMEGSSLLIAKKIFLNDDLTHLQQFNKKLYFIVSYRTERTKRKGNCRSDDNDTQNLLRNRLAWKIEQFHICEAKE
jgi:hypothetical protein